MTATTADTMYVEVSNKEKMGAVLAARRRARQAADFLRAVPGAALSWVVRTFHLEAGLALLKDFGSWTKARAMGTAHFLGGAGMTGLGLLAVGTETGRDILNTVVGKPLGWMFNLLGGTWNWARDTLREHFGAPGRWVSYRMDDLEHLTWGKDGHGGAIGSSIAFLASTIGPWLKMDSVAMQGTRIAGTALFGSKLVSYLAGTGWFYVGGFVLLAYLIPMTAVAVQTVRVGWFGKKAEAGVTTKSTDDSVNKAAEVSTDSGRHAHAAHTQQITPPNRASRRNSGKAAKAGARS